MKKKTLNPINLHDSELLIVEYADAGKKISAIVKKVCYKSSCVVSINGTFYLVVAVLKKYQKPISTKEIGMLQDKYLTGEIYPQEKLLISQYQPYLNMVRLKAIYQPSFPGLIKTSRNI